MWVPRPDSSRSYAVGKNRGTVRPGGTTARGPGDEEWDMAFAGNVDELALLQTVSLKKAVTAEVIAAHLGWE